MWRLSGSVTKKVQRCCCQVQYQAPVAQQHGRRCNYCTKPSETAPTGSPKAAPPPPPPPAPSPRKSGSALKVVLGGLLLGTGATVGTLAYAKVDSDFRRQVESNWPILLDVFPYFFDDEPAEKKAPTSLDTLTLGGAKKPLKAISQVGKETISDEGTGMKTPPTTTRLQPSEQEGSEPAPAAARSPAPSSPKASRELEAELRKEEERRMSRELRDKLIEQEIDEAASIAAYEAIVDSCMADSVDVTRAAVETQRLAIEATRAHTEKLKVAMGDAKDEDSETKKKQWDEVVTAAEVKVEAVTQASKSEVAAREALAKLKNVVEEAKQVKSKFGPSPRITGAQENLNQMTYDLESAISEVLKAQNEARILQKYSELIEKGREDFKKELQSLMPDVKIGRKGKKLTEEELNSLIAHAHRRVYQLQRELAEQRAMEQQRVAVSLDNQKAKDEEVARSRIRLELERQAADLAVLYEKKEEDLQSENEQEIRLQLRRQAAAHSDHLADVLQQQHLGFEKQLAVQEAVVREQERDNYYQQLSGAMAQLKGVEAAIDGRADLEMQNRKAQELWLACETLKRTIATGKTEGETWEDKLKPLANEIVAIREASPANSFVDAIIQMIPEEALTRGVFTEDALRQRWHHTQRVCRRVAMVGDAGGSMFSYFLSFFQSLLVLDEPSPPGAEDDVDPTTLDTFKLVSYVSYHVENGNLEQALRFANQLTGMPRRVATDWLTEARLLLETSQAASVLSSHASASGLGGLHFN